MAGSRGNAPTLPTNSKPHSDDAARGEESGDDQRPDAPDHRFHGRRQGRPLRKRRAALVDALLPALRIPLPAAGRIDPASLFDDEKAGIWLEIGFGGGEHLAWQARENPDVGFLGCEVFINGVASLLRHISDDDLHNVRIHHDDAHRLLDVLPDQSLDRIFLLHPDPWMKHRHAGRRFIQSDSIALFARLIKPGGILRIATDHPVYLGWTLRHMADQPWFEWSAIRATDWLQRPPDWPPTRYERKALKEGRRCTYLQYRRTGTGVSASGNEKSG